MNGWRLFLDCLFIDTWLYDVAFYLHNVNHLNFTFMNALTLAPAVSSSLTILAWPPWHATNSAVPPSTDAQSTDAPAFSRTLVMSRNPPCAAKKSAVVPVCLGEKSLETRLGKCNLRLNAPLALHWRQRPGPAVPRRSLCGHRLTPVSEVLCYPFERDNQRKMLFLFTHLFRKTNKLHRAPEQLTRLK